MTQVSMAQCLALSTVLVCSLEVEVVRLNEAARRRLRGHVVINQCGILSFWRRKLVEIMARFLDEEIGSVLRDDDGVSGMSDGLVRLTVHLRPSAQHIQQSKISYQMNAIKVIKALLVGVLLRVPLTSVDRVLVRLDCRDKFDTLTVTIRG